MLIEEREMMKNQEPQRSLNILKLVHQGKRMDFQ
jgi:hypothetical protein